jgi:hypothetical protein
MVFVLNSWDTCDRISIVRIDSESIDKTRLDASTFDDRRLESEFFEAFFKRSSCVSGRIDKAL